jgi:hypothetical protein
VTPCAAIGFPLCAEKKGKYKKVTKKREDKSNRKEKSPLAVFEFGK